MITGEIALLLSAGAWGGWKFARNYIMEELAYDIFPWGRGHVQSWWRYCCLKYI